MYLKSPTGTKGAPDPRPGDPPHPPSFAPDLKHNKTISIYSTNTTPSCSKRHSHGVACTHLKHKKRILSLLSPLASTHARFYFLTKKNAHKFAQKDSLLPPGHGFKFGNQGHFVPPEIALVILIVYSLSHPF